MGTITKVWRGDAGLARTYWLFGVIGSFVWGLLLGGVKPGSVLAIVGVVLFLIYIVMVNVGTWRAASRYDGPKAWAILAKMAVAALPAILVIGTLAAIVIPAKNQDIQPAYTSPPGFKPFTGKLDGEK